MHFVYLYRQGFVHLLAQIIFQGIGLQHFGVDDFTYDAVNRPQRGAHVFQSLQPCGHTRAIRRQITAHQTLRITYGQRSGSD